MSNIVIIGSGPAGVSAALYAARAGVQTTVLTKGPGALDRAELIQNYYGFAEPITGAELERRGIEGAKAVGVEFVTTEAVGLTYTDKLTVETLAGDFPADAVILATGASRAAPRIPGLAGLEGHGVSYCATCDGMLYRGKRAAVIGLAADAPAEADFLREIGCDVHYYDGKKHRFEIRGAERADTLVVDGAAEPADVIFVLRAGFAADTLLPGLATEKGHIVVDEAYAASIPGVFAAGDCTGAPYQIPAAVGEGNCAALSVVRWLRNA